MNSFTCYTSQIRTKPHQKVNCLDMHFTSQSRSNESLLNLPKLITLDLSGRALTLHNQVHAKT